MPRKLEKDINNGQLSRTPPKYLGQQAKIVWRKVVPFLETQANVNRIDSALVEMYCSQYEIYRNAYKHIRENGEVQAIYRTLITPKGEVLGKEFTGYKRNPMTQIYSDSLAKLSRIGTDLGLTPKGRAELSMLEIPEDEDDAGSGIEDFFK